MQIIQDVWNIGFILMTIKKLIFGVKYDLHLYLARFN